MTEMFLSTKFAQQVPTAKPGETVTETSFHDFDTADPFRMFMQFEVPHTCHILQDVSLYIKLPRAANMWLQHVPDQEEDSKVPIVPDFTHTDQRHIKESEADLNPQTRKTKTLHYTEDALCRVIDKVVFVVDHYDPDRNQKDFVEVPGSVLSALQSTVARRHSVDTETLQKITWEGGCKRLGIHQGVGQNPLVLRLSTRAPASCRVSHGKAASPIESAHQCAFHSETS